MHIFREMRKCRLAYIALVCCLAASFGAQAQSMRDFEINLGQFSKLKVDAPVNVVYSNLPDSTGYAVFSAPADLAADLKLSVKKSTFRIQLDEEKAVGRTMPTIYVYSDFLSEVQNSCDSTVVITDPSPCADFSARQIGNGTISVSGLRCTSVNGSLATGNGSVTLTGRCTEASLSMLGAGAIQADMLQADKVVCKILGTGSIGCDPQDSLTVKGAGTTKIYYRGDPVIKKSGGARLIPLDESEPDTDD